MFFCLWTVRPRCLEAEDLVAAKRLQKWLKAAGHNAAQGRTVNLHLADSRRSGNLPDGDRADESDLHSLDR